MSTLIIGDDPILIKAAYGSTDGNAAIITDPPSLLQLSALKEWVLHCGKLLSADAFKNFHDRQSPTFLLCFKKIEDQRKALDVIGKAGFSNSSFLLVQNEPAADTASRKDGLIQISISDLTREQIRSSLKKLENMHRLERLKKLNRATGELLILMQHDPDPDALASGLALRTLLDRNRLTAPLGSFGEVTRSENINMIRILDIPVLKITPGMLARFSRVAMVDVQPAYFVDCPIHADIVFDHHPYNQACTAAFSDIRTSYGATSTILGQYLLDAEIPIAQRLATALVYGIKTDTLSLERDITRADIDVFTRLYPQANVSMIRQIESASLDMHEIKIFIKALRNLTMIGTMACTWLGHIKNEAMIPRLADFSLQAAGAEWSLAAGISQQMVVCSARNVGYVKHAGELMHTVFGKIGSAGGHRSTAKAVIPLAQFKKHYKVKTSDSIAKALFAALAEANR